MENFCAAIKCGMNDELMDELKSECVSLRISFVDKAQMLANDYEDPPELLLRTPIIYKNKLINWIDADHLYGDGVTHLINLQGRLRWIIGYFGSGLFIYRNGYSPKINCVNKAEILLVDKFHFNRNEITILPRVEFYRNPKPNRYGNTHAHDGARWLTTKDVNGGGNGDSALSNKEDTLLNYLSNIGKSNTVSDIYAHYGVDDGYVPTDVTLKAARIPIDKEDLKQSDKDDDKEDKEEPGQKASKKRRQKRRKGKSS